MNGENFLFATFLPHASCYLWNSGLIWLHGISDGAIALAYFTIPLELLYFMRQRRDLPFPLVFSAFAIFILGCGATHLMDVITLWDPLYWLSGSIKAVTAVGSITTAIGLFWVVPSWARTVQLEMDHSVEISGVLSKPLDLAEITRLVATLNLGLDQMTKKWRRT